jgi:Glu-tRNA(Gln) amidotransferase subunit E-like FAD-binding protein
MILSGMGFDLLTELSGSEGRLDLCLALPEEVYCVIELKYCPSQSRLTDDEKNQALAKVAWEKLRRPSNKNLAAATRNKLTLEEFDEVLSKIDNPEPTEVETTRVLAKAAKEYLTKAEYAVILAKTARKELSKTEINAILKSATPTESLSAEEIDGVLSKAAMEALDQIVKNDYHGPLKLKAKKFIDLGLSFYGSGDIVKAAFRPL